MVLAVITSRVNLLLGKKEYFHCRNPSFVIITVIFKKNNTPENSNF